MSLSVVPPRAVMRDEHWEAGCAWYQLAYFEDRVEQELQRSRRYGTDTTVLLVRLPAVSRRAARSLYTFVSTQLRAIDTAGLMGTGDYGICLPHTPMSGGEVVAHRIRTFMEEYAPLIGVACYGKDGADFNDLFATATSRAA